MRYLREQGQQRIHAATRRPAACGGPADEAVAAELDDEAALADALKGAQGVFLVTNPWVSGSDEIRQATPAVRAAAVAGVDQPG